MRTAIAVIMANVLMVLSVLEAAPLQTAPSVKDLVAAMPEGSKLEVRLLNGDKVRGRLQAVSETGFNLDVARGKERTVQTIAFSDVQSVRRQTVGRTVARKLLVVGIVLGAITGGILIGCATHDWCRG